MLRNALYLAWTVAVAVALFACGSDTVQKASTTPTPADDGGVLDDGALVDNMVVEPPDVAMKPSKVTATNETVTVLGDTRQYVLVVPKTYDAARKYALIVALHGDGQDGPSFHALLTFDDVAGDDAIVAYPTGAVDLFTPYDQNGDQLLVDAVVNRLGLSFDVTIAGDEVHHAKPHREPYESACLRLAVDPRRAVVLEDSPAGIASGEAAGCAVVAVPSVAGIHPEPGPRRLVLTSLTELDLAALGALAAR